MLNDSGLFLLWARVPGDLLGAIVLFLLMLFQGPPASDAPVVDTQEQVYISSLALLKVSRKVICHTLVDPWQNRLL